MEQTAMYLPMENVESHKQGPQYDVEEELLLKDVISDEDTFTWIDVAASVFGYVIEKEVVNGLLDDSQIKVLNACDDGHAIASAL